MNSKGMEMSVTVIVVAVLALLILVVLIGVFTGQFGGFTRGVKDCESKGGICRQDGCPEGTVKYFGTGLCPDLEEADCCITVSGGCFSKTGVREGLCAGRDQEACERISDSCVWRD